MMTFNKTFFRVLMVVLVGDAATETGQKKLLFICNQTRSSLPAELPAAFAVGISLISQS
jgi:hypothetical protein